MTPSPGMHVIRGPPWLPSDKQTPPKAKLFDTAGSPVQRRDPASSSEAASLGGRPAKTPIIAGSVCGAVLLISWIVGFVIYFRKRANRKKRKRMAEEGLCEPPPEKVNPTRSSSERIVIPPDPAVILGYAKPGETVHVPREKSSSKTPPQSRSHSRSQSTASVKQQQQQQVPTPSRPVPLTKTKSHGHHHKKSLSHSHSLSKLRPSSPKKAEGDDETAPLNPHHINDSPQL